MHNINLRVWISAFARSVTFPLGLRYSFLSSVFSVNAPFFVIRGPQRSMLLTISQRGNPNGDTLLSNEMQMSYYGHGFIILGDSRDDRCGSSNIFYFISTVSFPAFKFCTNLINFILLNGV